MSPAGHPLVALRYLGDGLFLQDLVVSPLLAIVFHVSRLGDSFALVGFTEPVLNSHAACAHFVVATCFVPIALTIRQCIVLSASQIPSWC